MTRICEHCREPMCRRPKERPVTFASRRYCGQACNGAAKARRSFPTDGPPWTVNANGCWVWHRIGPEGYGAISLGARPGQAHRWLWEQMVGPIPLGMELDHLCRHRACVNPAHLEPVPHAVNVRRGASAKLSDEEADEIVARYARGGTTQRALAARYGVSQQYVSQLVRGSRRSVHY